MVGIRLVDCGRVMMCCNWLMASAVTLATTNLFLKGRKS
jgi:hypothetical protein